MTKPTEGRGGTFESEQSAVISEWISDRDMELRRWAIGLALEAQRAAEADHRFDIPADYEGRERSIIEFARKLEAYVKKG